VGPAQFERIQTNSNIFKYDSNDFKSVQISFDPNRNFPSSKNLKQNMVFRCKMDFELKFWESKV
jgi:hypothetical protein